MSLKITILLEPWDKPKPPHTVGPADYEPFAAALGSYAKTSVVVREDYLTNAPDTGFVLFSPYRALAINFEECQLTQREELLARLLLLDVDWPEVLRVLEKYHLVGAVTGLGMAQWHANQARSAGPFGLSRLAGVIGATCSPIMCSQNYCLYMRQQHQGLPHILAEYLCAYDADMSATNGVLHSSSQHPVEAFAPTPTATD